MTESQQPYKTSQNSKEVSVIDKLTSEKQLSLNVRQLAQQQGFEVYHTYCSMYSDVGFPDLTLAKPGRLIFAELKTERGKISAAQKQWLETLAATEKAEVFIWRPSDWPEIVEVLNANGDT